MRKKNKITMRANHKAFTLLELMVVIAIIVILATVILTNVMGVRQDAKDNNVLGLMSVTPESAYRCLTRNLPEIHLRRGDSMAVGNTNICGYDNHNGNTNAPVPGIPVWPTLANTGWSYGTDNSFWCAPGYSGSTPATCSPYADGACGVDVSAGTFCYMICNPTCQAGASPPNTSKVIWCTEKGCQKSGF